MNEFENIIKILESPEEKKKFEEWSENYLKEYKKHQKRNISIINNDDYMNWLSDFTKKQNSFFDDTWLYFPEKLSKEERINVGQLNNLFEAIENYTNENYIYGLSDNFGTYYPIKYNNVGYEIGIMVGQGTSFYCRRSELQNLESFIDFKDIQEGFISPKTLKTKYLLDKLSNVINQISNEDISLKAIADTAEKTLQKILNKKM